MVILDEYGGTVTGVGVGLGVGVSALAPPAALMSAAKVTTAAAMIESLRTS